MKDSFNLLSVELEKAKIPCRMVLDTDGITIECGWNYPDELFEKVWDITEKLDISVDICADIHSPTVIQRKSIFGGPKRY